MEAQDFTLVHQTLFFSQEVGTGHEIKISITFIICRKYIMESNDESPELKALRQYTAKLITALSTDPLNISGVLFSNGFLTHDAHQKMLLQLTPNEKANILMDAVITMIKSAPEMMEFFLETLDNELLIKDVAKELRSIYHGKKETDLNVVIRLLKYSSQWQAWASSTL